MLLFVVAGNTEGIKRQPQMIELLFLIIRANMHVVACRCTRNRIVTCKRESGMIYGSSFSGSMSKIRAVATLANIVRITFQLFLG